MQRTGSWTVVMAIVATLAFAACQRTPEAAHAVKPAHVEHIEGSELSRVTLTPKAMERLDIQSLFVREARVSRSPSPRKVVPYAAVLYDPTGRTWVYTRPEPQTFVRHEIVVDYIVGDLAVLSDGPPVGTAIVTVGATELFGAEFEIGH